MKFDIITIGGATEDITFYTNEGILIDNKEDVLRQKLMAFEYGAKIKINSSYSTFGGGAANAAVCVARLGLKVACVISLGHDDRGERILKNLKKHNVNISLVQLTKMAETGFSFLLVGQDNEHIVFSNRAANAKLQISKFQLSKLKNTKWIYMTSLSGEWSKALDSVFSLKKAKIAWNPGHIQLKSGMGIISGYIKKTGVLIINKDEALELVASNKAYKNKPVKYLNDIDNLLKIIKKWGPEIVLITNGKYGAKAFDGKKLYYQKVIKEKMKIDTTGIGDAFGSSFIVGLNIFKGNIKKAMLLASRNAASVISKQGAQNGLLTKREIDFIYKK